jgi:fanconi-associated nuclease 1
MVLGSQSPSMHNRLLGTKIPHPPSTKFNDDFPTPPAKRLKKLHDAEDSDASYAEEKLELSPAKSSRRMVEAEVADSEDEDLMSRDDVGPADSRPTQLETALPPVRTDEEAIEAYEAHAHAEDDVKSRFDNRTWQRGRSSIYVDAFNLALTTVLEEEAHLFNEAELTLFKEWEALSYECQYLYVRLFLRKTSKWFRVKDLPYYGDVADIDAAVVILQEKRALPHIGSQSTQHPGEFEPPEAVELGDEFSFAECSSDHITTLDEASSLLLLDELKMIAKDAKVQGKNKRELLTNLRRTSGRQAGLGFRSLSRTETEESTGSAVSESEKGTDAEQDGADDASNRDAHYTKKILDQTGRCIRLSYTPLKLFERVHLVFYRDTEWTEKSLTTLILARISRRNFPSYIVSRSSTIFESRDFLLEFEASLRTQFNVDNILEFSGTPGRKDLERIKDIFEAVYPRWQTLVAAEQLKEERVYDSGEGAYLRRFSPAWVYTRIIHKGLHPLARFKEHLREHGVLTELLDQRLFHAARRGSWYQRKALLEEHYMYALTHAEGRSEDANKKYWKRVALRTCEEGLEDRDCHIIYHFDLQKRIRKIEKQLRTPVREQHDFGHVLLAKAVERDVEGIKLEQEWKLTRKNSNGQPETRGAKTIWLDELDTQEHVSVESMCLSHYRKVLGWKGYHSEGGILRTLFGLLFCDVLFAYIPNVFQTAYQTCPLDLHTDSFYPARISEINLRINEIANGDAERIIKQTWDDHFERKTCIVGVRWDNYELDDILEIARCFEGQALGTVMRVMAQEYAARGGGVPDLFLWKPNEDGGDVMFVEVKSENDRLSDTQRLWISVLLGAGIKVELCHAIARETRAVA